MITTVTLNASIDKIYTVDAELRVGEVQRVARVIDNAGGKGLNCARAVATCGEDVVATGFVGGHNGAYLCERLTADGIPHDFVHTEQETRCCLNIIEPSRRSTEFLEPGRPVTPEEVALVEAKVRELAAKSTAVTLNGSVPAGCSDDIYRTLVSIVREEGARALLDTSGALLVGSLAARPDLIKPNTDEICAILGHKPESLEEVVAAAREVRERHGVGRVVVSLGGDGAVMSCAEGDFRGRAPKIEPVNTVGSGDTMVGAFAVALSRSMDIEDQLRFAMACATANCLTPATGNFEMETAERLMAETSVERLERP